ncbi:MAG: Na(+)-translocating NADH-quinone reductase subunit A [Gammaproteobacteria bacterium]|nr:Na(+)-translocating NADH-quinone reductase subunit A [Gammaproteobacteria bacterium]
MTIKIKRGLDLPLSGMPEQRIYPAPTINSVAVLGADYLGMKPTLLVSEGEQVKLGQVLFTDKKYPAIKFTAPASGIVKKIQRGAQRVLQAVIIECDHQSVNAIEFTRFSAAELNTLTRPQVEALLLDSGLWTALRTRPYSKTPLPGSDADAIFVTAIDTNPGAADPQLIIAEQSEAFTHGLTILSKLTTGTVYVCSSTTPLTVPEHERIVNEQFAGPHPAGLVGTHIHFLAPVSATSTVWHLDYQDVIAIGKLFATGYLWTERIVALGGPQVQKPRLLRTQLGANINELTQQQLHLGETRLVSGSILSGRMAVNWAGYLGRFHLQISALAEGREREFLGWIKPGPRRFSAIRAFAAHLVALLSKPNFVLNTSTNGSPRAMVPIGNYEKVMPLDILPTQLLRALVVQDSDTAQALGCLELDEEDLALCSFVSSSKYHYGVALRANLNQIEQEG